MVEYVAKSLAEKPDEVTVEVFERGGGTVAIKVKLADEDVGRFIGKAGRNIEALRTLVRVAFLRDRKRVFVDLANPSLSPHSAPRHRRNGGEVPACLGCGGFRGRVGWSELSRRSLCRRFTAGLTREGPSSWTTASAR